MYSQNQVTHHIATMAQRAVLYEVTASPKPGLVDRFNAGAHKDMDFYTFMDSSTTLYKGFFDCARIGLSYGIEAAQVVENNLIAGLEPFADESQYLSQLMDAIRGPGIEAEERMFAQTKGVNTHKGIIFSLGICCAALAYLEGKAYRTGESEKALQKWTMEQICFVVSQMTAQLIEHDFKTVNEKQNLSYGEQLYKKYGILGIRGEVASGFQTVSKSAFASLRAWGEGTFMNWQQEKLSTNELLLELLLRIMCHCEDSNLLTRGGSTGLKFVKEQAQLFVDLGGMTQQSAIMQIEAMDTAFTARNLSPGGSADLLSVAVFLAMCEEIL